MLYIVILYNLKLPSHKKVAGLYSKYHSPISIKMILATFYLFRTVDRYF